ncbi:MAG: EamA family transporter [Thermoleophilia bacterium]
MDPIRQQTRGYLLVVVTAVFWGFSGSLAKYLMQGAITPLTLTLGRSLITAAALLVFLLVRDPGALRLTRRSAMWAAGFGLSLAITQICYFSAIERLNVAAAILLEYMAPGIVVAFGWLFLKRRVTRITLASLVSVLIGSALVVEAYDTEALSLSGVGVAFGVTAALAFSTYILIGEHLQKLSMGVAAQLFYGFTLTSIVLVLLEPPWTIAPEVYKAPTLALVGVVGVFGTLVPFACFFASLRYIDAGHATIVSTLEPVVAGLVSLVWFGEVFSVPQLIGAALVIGAIVALQRDGPATEAIAAPEFAVFTETASARETDPSV